jgi:hypothetical protein
VRQCVQAARDSYEPSDLPKSSLYIELLPRLNSKTIKLLDHPRLLNQLCSLERRTARGGRDSVDHSHGGKDDIANAVAGLSWIVAGKVQHSFSVFEMEGGTPFGRLRPVGDTAARLNGQKTRSTPNKRGGGRSYQL